MVNADVAGVDPDASAERVATIAAGGTRAADVDARAAGAAIAAVAALGSVAVNARGIIDPHIALVYADAATLGIAAIAAGSSNPARATAQAAGPAIVSVTAAGIIIVHA